MCAALGLQAACVAGVLVNRTRQEIPSIDHAEVETNTVKVALEAAKILLAK
jgi:uridine phosphorylase